MIIAAMCQYVQLTENVTDSLIVKLLKVGIDFSLRFLTQMHFQSARSGRAPSECTMALAIVCAQESVKKLPLKLNAEAFST